MTIDAKCTVCKNAERRRLIELGWNGGMGAETMSRVLGDSPTSKAIIKHLKEHADQANTRAIEVEPDKPARERVLALQRLQLDEVERRIGLAKSRAAQLNDIHKDDDDWQETDWSDLYDILGKDAQAAIGSILKTQGLSDKREKTQGELKLGLFEAMAGAGLAPKALVGGDVPQLLPENDLVMGAELPGDDLDD